MLFLKRKSPLPPVQTVSVILLTGCFAFKKIWHLSFPWLLRGAKCIIHLASVLYF